MKKYIKTLIFVLTVILIFGVVLSDPTQAKLGESNLKDRMDTSVKFKTAEDTYDFKDYNIRWNNTDWIKLVRGSKNILEIKLNKNILTKRRDEIIQILDNLHCDRKESKQETLIRKDIIKIDYNLFKRIYCIESGDDEDSHIIISAIFNK